MTGFCSVYLFIFNILEEAVRGFGVRQTFASWLKLHHIWPERPTKQLISSGQRGMTGALPMLLLCCLTSVSTAASFRAQSLVFQQYGELWGRSPGSPGPPGSTSLPLLLQTGHGRRGTPTLNTCSDYFFKRNYSKVANNLN